jgi:hypothetical protein
MFTERQKIIRCMIYRNRDHSSIPAEIPREKLEDAHRFLCEYGETQDFHRFKLITEGKVEPRDDEMSSKLAIYNWYEAPWYTGPKY